jgi:hypothetical protein
MIANGAYQATTLSNIAGITILGPTQFDINVNNVGPFTQLSLASPTVLPGRYWTSAGAAAWDNGIASCSAQNSPCFISQYTLGPIPPTGSPTVLCSYSCVFPAANLNVDPNKVNPYFDPIAAHILIGSGPWTCGTSAGLGQTCSPGNVQNPGVGSSYTLTRFGAGLPPASSGSYFRSNGNLALYLWTENNGDFTHDFLNYGVVTACYGQATTPLGSIPAPSSCAHFQQGIGANGGPKVVDITTVGIVNRFMGLNWVSPFNWVSSPPVGIVPLPPVLYENTLTLKPSVVAGCTAPYPTGGYDC